MVIKISNNHAVFVIDLREPKRAYAKAGFVIFVMFSQSMD